MQNFFCYYIHVQRKLKQFEDFSAPFTWHQQEPCKHMQKFSNSANLGDLEIPNIF